MTSLDVPDKTFVELHQDWPRTADSFWSIVHDMETQLGLKLVFQPSTQKFHPGWWLAKNRSNNWAHTPKRMWVGNIPHKNDVVAYVSAVLSSFRRSRPSAKWVRFFGEDLFNFLFNRCSDA